MSNIESKPVAGALRKIFVYVKTETTMDKLKPGDIFTMEPASERDVGFVDPLEYLFVESGPFPQEGKPEGYFEVKGSRLIKDPDFGGKGAAP